MYMYEGLRAKVFFWLKLEKKICNIKNSKIMFTKRLEKIISS